MNIDPPADVVRQYIGKTVLAGITKRDTNGSPLERKQYFGTIVRLNRRDGLVLRLASGEEFALPPTLERLEKAQPGQYRIKSTGEVIENPDFVVTWSFTPPKK